MDIKVETLSNINTTIKHQKKKITLFKSSRFVTILLYIYKYSTEKQW